METMRDNIFNSLSFLSLLLVIILLPIFFLPFTGIPVEVSKGLLLVVGLALAVIFWAVARFYDGKISMPRSLCLASGGGIVLVYLLSALFSGAPGVSFFGTMFDVGTFWFVFSGFLLMLLCSMIFRNTQSARVILFGVVLASALLLVFQTLRIFMPAVLSFRVLSGSTDNLLGSWNAFGLFAGFSALMSLLVIEFFSIGRSLKWTLQALLVLSMALVACVNSPLTWELVGISSLIIFVYKVSFTSGGESETQRKPFPAFSFGVVMISLLFFISGNFIGSLLPNYLGLANTEVGPSLSATTGIAKSVLETDPLLGTGPNRFAEAWAMYKPVSINNTAFWDISFGSGSGLLPTLVATTGFFGILSWLAFFVLFILSGVKSLFAGIKKGVNWEVMAFFVLSLYLFASSFFYSTGPVIFLLALALTGVFLGLSASNKENGEFSILFLNDHRRSFFSMLLLVLVIVLSSALAFKYVERFASVPYFRSALAATTVAQAETSINKALALNANDLYWRTYAQVYVAKLNSLAAKGTSLSDADKALLQTSLNEAVSGAQLAIAYDSRNYLNFESLGSVYEVAASLGVKSGYSQAVQAYSLASSLNPKNPRLELAMANASFSDGKTKEAKDYASAALALKPDYINALVVLSQIVKSEGDNAGALSYAQQALSISPADKNLIQYVNSLKNPSSSSTTSPQNSTTDNSKSTSSKKN